MGGLTSLERVFTKLLRPNVYKYGKCLGKEGQNGIRVYERFEQNGKRVLTSLKNGELYKTTEINKETSINEWCQSTTSRHDVIVRNFETGNVFNSYKGTTKCFDGTREEFFGKSLMKPNFGELDAFSIQSRYRGNQLIHEYNTKISKGGTYYRCEGKSYNAENKVDHVRLELRATNYKMPNGQIVNYDRTQHFLPKDAYDFRQKDVRYLEPTSGQMEITQNGIKQINPNWSREALKFRLEQKGLLKG